VGAAALLAASVAIPQAAGASSGGRVSATTTASTTSWGVVLAPTTVTTVPSCPSSPYCANYTFRLPAGTAGAYFDAWNTGSVVITGLSYLPTWTGGGRITMYACSVAWNTVTGVCPGTRTTVFTRHASGTYGVVTAATAYPAPVGGETLLHVVAAAPRPPANSLVTLSTSVCSGGTSCKDGTAMRQIRAAKTTNA
jgi:hypothetical protein